MSTVAAIPNGARVHSGRGRSDSASLIRQRPPQGGANPQPTVGQRSYSFHSRQQQQQQQQQSQDKYHEYQRREKELRTALSDDYEEIDSDDGSYHSEGDDIAQYWDPYLYQLQQQAPRPKKVSCRRQVYERPSFYGDEYHGAITREETAMLLGKGDGNYLVRKGLSQSGTYSLSFVFGGNIRHYRLFFENGEHFVGETTFDDIEDLVADGLITLHMELNNVEEYLKNAQESKRLSKDSYGVGAGIDTSAVSTEKLEPLPPPLPPRNRVMSPDHLTPIAEEVAPRPQPREDYTNTVLKKKDLRQENSLYDYHYEKPHNFKIHTFLNMPWCDLCHNFLWGLRSQGYKCKDCGYVAHKQCKDCTAADCAPTKQLIKRIYGVDLTTLLKVYSTKIPIVVKHCIEELERRGLGIDGLYRIPGKAMEILEIKKQFDSGINVNLGSYEDPHAIAGALKLYFRELPIPLIPFDSFDLVLIAARCATEEETLETVRVILSRIPPSHYNTLKFLIKHLYNVQRESKKNRMDSKNLAVVFAPSLMRPPANADQLSAMMKLPEQKRITELFISHYDVLFPALY